MNPNKNIETSLPYFDLRLPMEKKPTPVSDVHMSHGKTLERIVENYAIGSSKPRESIYATDLGLFGAVLEAWENHWNLRTSPEDWWFPVACRVAKVIDETKRKQVCEDFVAHEGKEDLAMELSVDIIHEVSYESLFSALSSKIQRRIKVPSYALVMQNDFSTSSESHIIASQINLLASMQEFFEHKSNPLGCGIKGLEMLGTQADWNGLLTKLRTLRKALEPILSETRLGESWFDSVELVYSNLAKTFSAKKANVLSVKVDASLADFWADILMIGKGWKYGSSGTSREEVEVYNGWLISFLTGNGEISKVDMMFGSDSRREFNGINKVPLKMTTTTNEDSATLMAGMIGYQVHLDASNQVPSVQPHHMWAMTLPPDSPLRRTHWGKRIISIFRSIISKKRN